MGMEPCSGTPGEMLGRAEPCSHPGINQCQGWVETSKGSADCWEALKQILEVGWKMLEVGAELVGDGSPLGSGVSDGCWGAPAPGSASPCTGSRCCWWGLHQPLSLHPNGASGD